MMNKVLIFCLSITVIVQVLAQDKEYEYAFSGVKLLENPNVNSYAEEIYPLYDKSYDTLFMVRSHHNENVGRDKINQDIWYSYKKDGQWSDMRNFKKMNNAENNSIVGIANSRERLYLLNSYTSTLIRNKGIVYTDYEDGEWTKPLTIDFQVNTGNKLYAFFINHLEDVIVITMFNERSEGEEDLFVSLKGEGGHWRNPIYMGHTINSEGYETSPFLTDDKKTLFFSSNGFGGYGEADIFMSERLDDSWSSWTEPVNLGAEVNSDKFDGYFSIYDNGEFLLASNRYSKFSDIFTGNWELVEVVQEEKEELVPVSQLQEALKNQKKDLPVGLNIYFDRNSSKFDESSYQSQLNEIVTHLSRDSSIGLIVEGQTDDLGSESYNLNLSYKRAKVVTDYIRSIDTGLNENRIILIPSGESKAGEDVKENRKVVVKYVCLDY
ncbi:MAG: OmpA family protein [Cyclobacteriaceae bacterium]